MAVEPRDEPIGEPARDAGQSLLERCLAALEDDPHCDLEALLGAELGGDTAARSDVDARSITAAREGLRLLGRVGLLASTDTLPSTATEPSLPERLGEFRILRQLGRGGMGVVYLAVQESLGREVALKLVHPEHLYFPQARDRFRREVRAAARLQHSGIVPVHTFGEADGVPFYAMERVSGASLAELLDGLAGRAAGALDGLSMRDALAGALRAKDDSGVVGAADRFRASWVVACCGIVRDVARALHHAHTEGVLHRDLKPSNVLLAADGRALLIDFGLALADGEDRMTRSGATLGSLPYLAPEQLRDASLVDRRTDVHGLGATFYELLTLAPPYGDGSPGTRERILAGRLEPPTRRNPQVPVDVEAICLCALDPNPARRYPTAAAFADDLDRFLDRRPVVARRPTAWRHLIRFVHRRPALTVAVVSVTLLVLGAPTVVAIQQRLAAEELRRALADATYERDRADRHLGEALAAVDTMLSRTAVARLARVPRTARLRRQLLEDALSFQLRLSAREPGDGRVRLATVAAQRRVGALRVELGEFTAALDDLARAGEELATLEVSAAVQLERTQLEAARARALGRLGRREEQRVALTKEVELYAELCTAAPTDERLAGDAARTQIDLAVLEARLGAVPEALARLAGVLEELDRWLTDSPETEARARWATLRVTALNGRAVVEVSAGQPIVAAQTLQAATEAADAARALAPDDPAMAHAVAGVAMHHALLLHDLQDHAAALPALEAAVEVLEGLVRDEPEDLEWTAQLGLLLSTRADVRTGRQELDAARQDHRRALELFDLAVERQPDDRQQRARRAIARGQFASFLGAIGERAAQRAQLAATLEDQRALQAERPGDAPLIGNLAVTLTMAAALAIDDGELDAGREFLHEALGLLRGQRGLHSVAALVDVLHIEFDRAFRAADAEAVAAALDESEAVIDSWLTARPDDAQALTARGRQFLNRGLYALGRFAPDQAIVLFQTGLDDLTRAMAAGYAVARPSAATTMLRLADAHLRLDDVAAARTWFVRAVRETGASRAEYAHVEPLAALFDRADFAAAAAR